MSVNITGFDEMMTSIEKSLGSQKIEALSKKALLSATPEVSKRIRENLELFKDTGASIEEIKEKLVKVSGHELKVKIYWEGPKDRYKIIHLNEKGYDRNGKRYNPRGKGAIARALRSSEGPYFSKVEEVLKR